MAVYGEATSGAAPSITRTVLVGVPALVALFVLGLVGAQWPNYWEWIAPEDTPLMWLSSVILMLTAATCLMTVAVLRLSGVAAALWRAWFLLALAFGWLALDERFAVHDQIQSKVLAPRDIAVPFMPWAGPGDFLLVIYAIVGGVVLWKVRNVFRGSRGAVRLVVGAFVAAAVAAGLDTIDPTSRSEGAFNVLQSVEEIIETSAWVCFLLACVVRCLDHLVELRGLAVAPGPPAGAAGADGISAATGRTPGRQLLTAGLDAMSADTLDFGWLDRERLDFDHYPSNRYDADDEDCDAEITLVISRASRDRPR